MSTDWASMSRPVMCGFCNKPAVWRWVPKDPPPAYNQFKCDDHAAQTDLDELEDLTGVAS